MYAAFQIYTDGYMLVTGLQWLAEDVIEDQSAGLCVRSDGGNSPVSCWEAVKSDTENVYAGYIYYLLGRDEPEANVDRLRDAAGIYYGDLFPGYMGRWHCDGLPTNDDLVDTTVCRRFLPDAKYSNDSDERFSAGQSLQV